MSSAVGPSITLPNTVGAISTPFVILVGTASTTCETSGRESLSNTISSPRRGVTVKPSCPSIRSSSSERSPAAFTKKRVRHSRPPARTRTPPPSRRSRPVTAHAAPQLAAGQHGLGGERERRRERADDPLVGHLERAERARPEVRLAPVELLGRELADRLVAVRVRLLDDARQRAELLLGPGHEQRPGPLDGDADPLGVAAELLVAAHDELGLERPRLGVEARVQQGGVRLARAGADVGPRLEQRHAQVEERQLAGDRAADDPAAGYQDIAVEPALHAREYPVRPWRRPPARASR